MNEVILRCFVPNKEVCIFVDDNWSYPIPEKGDELWLEYGWKYCREFEGIEDDEFLYVKHRSFTHDGTKKPIVDLMCEIRNVDESNF